MRRPTIESDKSCCNESIEQQMQSNNSIKYNDEQSSLYGLKKEKRTSESRFAKVKRILSGTLLMGRSQDDTNTTTASSKSKKSADIKSTRKRDRSREPPPYQDTDLKLTKLVEYEIQLQQKTNKSNQSSPKNIRKRKEHHEVVSPPNQERKLIRSNSEERPPTKLDDIRRVSSHEDFKQVEHHQPLREITADNTPPPVRSSPNKISPNRDPKYQFYTDQQQRFAFDYDHEQEQRRASERFSRPLAPRGRSKIVANVKKRKKHEPKLISDESKRDNETPDESNTNNLPLDLSTLHEQIDGVEPRRINPDYLFTSNNNDEDDSQPISLQCSLSSPRNSLILARKVYLDPLIPIKSVGQQANIKFPEHTVPANPVEARIKHVSKQISSLKKKMKKMDDQQTPDERLNDKKIRSCQTELNKLKKELKCLKSDPMQMMYSAISSMADAPKIAHDEIDEVTSKKRVEMIKETLIDVQKRLFEKRQHANRPEEIGEMTDEQLIEEKIAVQKALLHLESIHGRPVSKEDRDVVRSLYDRYRILKRIVARTTNAKLNNSIELGTILEDETMHFVSTPIQDNDKVDDGDDSPSPTPAGSMDSSDTDTSINENLHALTLNELIEQQRTTREEKKQIRRQLKEYEHDFEMKTGKKIQKDDRQPMECTYFMYKQIKGKLKLIDILIEKKQQHQQK